MIKWCSYCQSFMAEVPPFDDYGVTHGVCERCLPNASTFGAREQDLLEPILDFYRELGEIAMGRAEADVASVLNRSRRLGIKPVDLMFGMLAPLLAQVGDLWASGEITVHAEHRISGIVEGLLAGIRMETPGASREAIAPELLLLSAEGNQHTIGLRMAEAYFAIQGVPALTMVPGLPTDEVLGLLEALRPRVLGFSVALATQMRQVRDVRRRLGELSHPPKRIIVGGPALRLGLHPDASLGIDVCRNLSDVPALLDSTT